MAKVWCRAIPRAVQDGKPSTAYDTGFKHSGDIDFVMNAVDGNDLKLYPWEIPGGSAYPPGGNPYQTTPSGVYDTFFHEFVLEHPGYRPGVLQSAEFVTGVRGEGWYLGVEAGSWPLDWVDFPPDTGHCWVNLEIRSWNPPPLEGGGYVYQGFYVGGNVWQELRTPVPQGVINWLNSPEGDTYWLEGKNHPKDASGYWKEKCYWPEDDPRTIVGIGSTCPPNQFMQDKDKIWVRLTGDFGGRFDDPTDSWQRGWFEIGKLGVEFVYETLSPPPTPSPPAPPRQGRGTGLGDMHSRRVSFPARRR